MHSLRGTMIENMAPAERKGTGLVEELQKKYQI